MGGLKEYDRRQELKGIRKMNPYLEKEYIKQTIKELRDIAELFKDRNYGVVASAAHVLEQLQVENERLRGLLKECYEIFIVFDDEILFSKIEKELE